MDIILNWFLMTYHFTHRWLHLSTPNREASPCSKWQLTQRLPQTCQGTENGRLCLALNRASIPHPFSHGSEIILEEESRRWPVDIYKEIVFGEHNRTAAHRNGFDSIHKTCRSSKQTNSQCGGGWTWNPIPSWGTIGSRLLLGKGESIFFKGIVHSRLTL